MVNRRKFFQVSAASFIAENLFAGGEPLPAGAQRFGGRQPFEGNPYHDELQRLRDMTEMVITGWKTHPDNIPHAEDPGLNDSDWTVEPSMEGMRRRERDALSGEGGTWFRKLIEIPKSMGGYNIQGMKVNLNAHVRSRTRGMVRVFVNGGMVEMTEGNTQGPIPLMDEAVPGRKFLVAAYAPGPAVIFGSLQVVYPPDQSNPQTMMEEIISVQAASKGFPDGQAERDSQLKEAVGAIDFNALDRGDQSAFNSSLAAADAKMEPLAEWMKQFTILAVGNSHIDLAWLWPWPETVEVVRNTFGTVLELQDEYPGLFYYAQSSAQDFLWLERYYPSEFKEIQKRVKDGRWQLVGGMWCEPDLNMPCGESLVRQLLTGKDYFQKKFGVDVKIGWNPDSFGYSWQLAQIYKRSGVDYFVTQKISWNDTTKFPYKLFQWESPDGSRVLTFFPHGYGNQINVEQCSGFLAEDVPLCSGYKEQMLLFGMGDHGGGPTRQMLDAGVRWQKSPKAAFPTLKFGTPQGFFDSVDSNLASLNLPVWDNELYLEYHRGTYTTQSESKRRMRESEVLMLTSEKFCSLAQLHGRAYPQDQFEDCWRRICFDQFHDMMAGSGIHVNYEDEAENLDFVKLTAEPQLHASLETLEAMIDTRSEGVPVVVFNPLSWERNDVREVEVQFPGALAKVEVLDPDGRVTPSAEVSRNKSTRTVKVRFLARGVPAMGYKVFRFVSTAHPREAASTLKVNGTTMENEFLRVVVDPTTGCVTSLVNKKDGKNILRPGANGNLLETFVDKPREFDAWNIGWPYEQTKTELVNADDVKLVENTPVRAVVRVKKHFQNSSFVQDICVYPGIARADVHMHADWHETHIMLKVAFPLAISPEKATYEIPYGTIERPAIPTGPDGKQVPFTEATFVKKRLQTYNPLAAQEAMFEVCAQRWGDLSQNGRGFSLLNASKYGYDTVEPGTIRLTLLRSPTSPDPIADRGPHDFTYAMFPHAGDWREAGTEFAGYELNYPVHAHASEVHEGALPASHSFVQIEPRNVILTAVKKADADNSLIFRFFEFEGKDSQVTLTLPEAASNAVETNLMEKEENPVSLGAGGKSISVAIGHYEIKSVKVEFPGAAGSQPPRRV
ncbi:MAG: alpha-mannosidase [Acidobacteriota bacterium]|nr:alpha-mannosidase [Acidobacteriota bacterium]